MPIKLPEDDITSPVHRIETWNTCPGCNKSWKEEIPIQGVIHRTVLCKDCCKRNNEKHFRKR